MNIITNWKPRDMLSLYELPAKERLYFDYVEDDDWYTPRFVKYRSGYYDVFDTQRIEPDNGQRHHMGWAMRVHPGSPLCLFDSVESDSFFSGLLFRLEGDDRVVVARYFT
jgi:hypothetical protein